MPVEKRRRRYLVFDVHLPPASIQRKELENLLWNRLMEFHGELSAAECRPSILEYDNTHAIGVARCRHNQIVPLRAALAIGFPPASSISIHIMKITGTMRRAKQILLELQRHATTFYDEQKSSIGE